MIRISWIVLYRLGKALRDIRVLYGLGGIIFSIIAHELFHILMHIDSIERIELFPDVHAIVAITATTASGYSVNFEELIAYSITLIILVITALDVFAINDSKDKKDFSSTLFPAQSDMHDLDDAIIHELAIRSKLI